MGRNKYIWLLLLFLHLSAFAEEHRFMVFLSDKASSAYSIESPEAFLSTRAIERRQRQGIPITEDDLPVNEGYIDQITSLGASVFFQSRWMNAVLVQMDSALTADISNLSFVDSIHYIAKGARLSYEKVPFEIPESFKTPQAISATTELQLSMLWADSMHNDGYKGEGMYIAILDAGFPGVNEYKPFEHIHTENRLIAHKDFVTNSGNPFLYSSSASAHGTSVLSTIAMDYGEEVQGIAPKASFILCVTEDVESEYRIEEYNWLLGAEFADSVGADIINASLGYSTFNDTTMNYTQENLDGETAIVTWAATKAAAKGMVVVVSGGNSGNKSWKYVTPPGDAEGILVVGSVNAQGERASFSSLGPTSDGRIKPDVMALGSPATVFDGSGYPDRVTYGSGTSFSSPLIAGFAAAIWQANPEWTSQEVINAIKYSGNMALSPDVEMGYGIPDYRLAVTNSTLSVSDIFENKLKVYPNPFHEGKLNIDLKGVQNERFINLVVTDLNGAALVNQRIEISGASDKHEIDFPAVCNGIYLLKVSSATYNKTIKLIKY
ncbi:MAG: S8 family peptidase [Cyclobacteriaceae bacterium]